MKKINSLEANMFSQILALISNLAHFILGIGTPSSFPPPLSQKEEQECFERMADGDEQARQKLILHNLRLCSHIVRKYYSSSKNQEDLVSIGVIGLVKAVDSFNISNGTRFATYAARCIQNEILMHFRSQKKLSCEVSLSETIDTDRDGNPLTYIDVICADDTMPQDVERKISAQKALKYVDTLLDSRERQIIRMRYGLGGGEPLTQREVAKILNISRSYVSRIEKSALEKLNGAMREV
jgi:RNA polymerase sporulation-specific sigma factor